MGRRRAEGKLTIHDLLPTNVGAENYDFNDLNSVHVVNCPTPMTLDARIHNARRLLSAALPTGTGAGLMKERPTTENMVDVTLLFRSSRTQRISVKVATR